MIGLVTLPHKLAIGGLVAALLVTSGFATLKTFETRRLAGEKVALQQRIDDPKTGYIVRLTQAETNKSTCTAAIGQQNAAIRDQAKRSAATVAAVQARYDREHAARVAVEKAAAVFLSRQPRGATTAERVADVDAQILGDLK